MTTSYQICRICLKKISTTKLISLFRKNKESNYSMTNAELLMACSSVQVSENDNLPQNICLFCHYKLTQMYNFKVQCDNSDTYLRSQIILDSDFEKNSIFSQLKTEIKDHDYVAGTPANDDTKSEKSNNDSITTKSTLIKLESELNENSVDLDLDNTIDDDITDTVTIKAEVSKVVEFPPKIICMICEEEFLNTTRLRFHIKEKHRYIKCRICNRQFHNHRNLKIHLSVMHKPKPHINKLVGANLTSLSNHIYQKRRSTICPICSETLNTLADLKAHMIEYHKTVICKECGKSFNQYRYLRRHMKTHTNYVRAQHLCPQCGRVFTESSNLITHIRIHTGEKPYECKECGRKFGQWSSLRSHKLTHSTVKNYACEICGKAFVRERSLMKHKITHSEERNFPCKLCDKRFKTQASLKDHLVIHTGVKKFQCEICSKVFGFKRNLVVHMRIHTGEKPHVCQYCGQGFTQSHCLRAHLASHHPEQS